MLSFQTVAISKPDVDTSLGESAAVAAVAAVTVPDSQISGTVAPAPGDALRVLDLRKSFRSGFLKRKIRGIEGVSFTVPRGTVFALLGHNGAGKTTTINCILDLVHPDGGEVSILGVDHRCCASRVPVGYLPERPYFFEHLTGRELLAFYADLLGMQGAQRKQRIGYVLDRTGMSSVANRRLGKYSKGMLQRIGLAQTLLGDPDLLILDEPMSGLDPMGRREVRELLLELKAQGKTIILSSHIVPDVEMIADTVGFMCEGRLVATRDLKDLGAGCQYKVNLDATFDSATSWPLPAWSRQGMTETGQQSLTIEAPDVNRLRELLAVCHEQNINVQSVDSRRTSLEDTFMSIHTENKDTMTNVTEVSS